MNLTEISSTQRFDVVTANNNFEATKIAALFGIKRDTTVALTLGLYLGIFWTGAAFTDLGDETTVALTGSATNYVEANRTTGAVTVNQSAFTAGRIRLYTITTNANGITGVTDYRTLHLQGGNLDVGTLTAAALTIAQGTLTDPATGLALTATWNDAADLFVGLDINITNTNSLAGSLPMRVRVGGTGFVGVTTLGQLLVSTNTPILTNGSLAPGFQVSGTSAALASAAFTRWASGSGGAFFIGGKARGGTTVGTHGAVTSSEILFSILAEGSDGSAFARAARFDFSSDGTVSAGVVPGKVSLQTATAAGVMTEALALDSAQKVLAGLTTALTIGQSNRLQIGGTGSINGGIGLSRFSADAVGTRLEFSKSRHATMGSNTITQSGDALGSITWYGADGTNYDAAAQIIAEVDGTPGAGTDMPGRIRFLTSADGTATLTERLRIDNAGNVVVNTAAIATGATDGFLYVPTCAGTPSGTPTTHTGRAPVIVDTTNHRWYFYSGGSWRNAGP